MVILTKTKSPPRKGKSGTANSASENGNSNLKNASPNSDSKSDEHLNSSKDVTFNNLSKRLDLLCSNYDQFIIPDPNKSDQFKEITKSLYEYGQKAMKTIDSTILSKAHTKAFKPLSNLLVSGFDNEQIWQQLDVFNKPVLDGLVSEIANLSSRSAFLTLNIDTNSPQSEKLKKNLSKSILKTNDDLPEKTAKKDKKKVKFIKEEEEELNDDNVQLNNIQENVDFFNIDEMETFLDVEDRKEMNDHPKIVDEEEEEDIDYFADMPSDSDEDDEEDDNEKDAMYSDFFDPPKIKNLTTTIEKINSDDDGEEDDGEEDEIEDDGLDTRDFDADDLMDGFDGQMLADASSSDEEDFEKNKEDKFNLINQKLKALANENLNSTELDNGDLSKSEFEKSQLKLRRKIEKAERELLHPSNLHWQLSGETTGDVRPENSLLEEHLQFDHVSKPAPMITDQTTLSLEGLIKQRIKDKAFDDVERKEKPNEQPFEFRRRILLESEKSKVGLAEVYEQEYVKKQQQLKEQEGGSSLFAVAGEIEETETRKDIRRMMRGLFRKLDSLSAFHYTPRPPEPEVKIINNLPAISVEEVTPDTVSDMKLLAPEEVFSTRGKKVLQAKGERDGTDRKRARRLKKKKQSIKQQMETRTKLKANSVNKVEIEKIKKISKKAANESNNSDKKAFSSSTKFFERLQESKDLGKAQKLQKRKKANLTDPNLSKKLKL